MGFTKRGKKEKKRDEVRSFRGVVPFRIECLCHIPIGITFSQNENSALDPKEPAAKSKRLMILPPEV